MASNVLFRPPPPILPGQVGVALIVANDYWGTNKRYLSGTVKDADRMVKAFEFLGYRTIPKLNISKADFVKECETLASYNYESANRCKRIAVVFSGHGDIVIDTRERGVLIMQDEEIVIVNDLVNTFKPSSNCTLTNTIRMFFIDACRGEMEEPRVVSRSPRGGNFTTQASTEAGIIIAYSTTENHKAYEGNDGGFWIQFLAQEMCTSDESLQAILTKVNKKLNEQCNRLPKEYSKMQTAQVVSQLIEDVYFLKERPQLVAGSTPGVPPDEPLHVSDQLSSPSADHMEVQLQIKETLTLRGITYQYHIVETPSRRPGQKSSYTCELTCHSNGMNYKFSSKQSYHDRDDAKKDVNEQASQCPEINGNEISSRSAEDQTSRVDKLAEYCNSKGYRPPSYQTKPVANGCYVSTVLVPRNGKYEGEVADNIEQAKEKAAKTALLDLKVISDPFILL